MQLLLRSLVIRRLIQESTEPFKTDMVFVTEKSLLLHGGRLSLFVNPIYLSTMRLIITTHDCQNSNGFTASINPVVVALQSAQPTLENIEFHNGRITATKEGYPVRFAVKNFTTKHYRDLMYGQVSASSCLLEALPVPVTRMVPA